MISTTIVITMAGRGSRFVAQGFQIPKYEIMVKEKSLLKWSLISLKNFINNDVKLVFVALKENKASNFIAEECKKLNVVNFEILELPEITDGQATSAYNANKLWNKNSSLLIYNIDTFINNGVLNPSLIKRNSDGWIPCFKAKGDHWSFVKINSDGWATEVAEKKRISDFASIGLYWFKYAQYFMDIYEEDRNSSISGERYIAPLYNELIKNKLKISISNLPSNEVHVLGTPEELNIFKYSIK